MKINLEIEITKKCNLSCFYCCAETQIYKNKNTDLNWKVLKFFLKTLKKSNLKIEYLITGGEPLIYPYINEFFSFFDNNEIINITLLSNLTIKPKIKNPLKDVLTSLHIEYYDLFKNKIFDNLINLKALNKRINIILDDFDNSRIDKIELKKILIELQKNNIKLIPQFLTNNLNYNEINLNYENRKKWFNYLKDINWYFYEIETSSRFKDYFNNNFDFYGTFCYPLGYILRYNGDLQRDCGSFPTLCNIYNNLNCWKKIKVKKIKCKEHFCNPQITIENPKKIHGDF